MIFPNYIYNAGEHLLLSSYIENCLSDIKISNVELESDSNVLFGPSVKFSRHMLASSKVKLNKVIKPEKAKYIVIDKQNLEYLKHKHTKKVGYNDPTKSLSYYDDVRVDHINEVFSPGKYIPHPSQQNHKLQLILKRYHRSSILLKNKPIVYCKVTAQEKLFFDLLADKEFIKDKIFINVESLNKVANNDFVLDASTYDNIVSMLKGDRTSYKTALEILKNSDKEKSQLYLYFLEMYEPNIKKNKPFQDAVGQTWNKNYTLKEQLDKKCLAEPFLKERTELFYSEVLYRNVGVYHLLNSTSHLVDINVSINLK